MTEQQANPENISEQTQQELEQRTVVLENAPLDASFDFKEFWAYTKATNERIRSSKFLDPEILAGLRSRVDAACERVKQYQDTRSAFVDGVSALKRKYIEERISRAKEIIESDNNKSQLLLREILPLLKDEWKKTMPDLSLTDDEVNIKMNKDDREACWLYWRQVNDQCFIFHRELKQNNFIRLRNELYALADIVNNAEPLDALTAIKEFQKTLKGTVMEKSDWDEVRAEVNSLWERADQRFKTFKSQRSQDRIERRKKMDKHREHWRVRQETNIQKFNDLISKNFDVITKIENHIEKLQGDLLRARNNDFKAKIETWINEQQDKIADIQKANRELNQKIASVEEKMERVAAGEDPYADKQANRAVKNSTPIQENNLSSDASIDSSLTNAPNENNETKLE